MAGLAPCRSRLCACHAETCNRCIAFVYTILCRMQLLQQLLFWFQPKFLRRPFGPIPWALCGSNADMLFALDIIIRLHDVANVPRACLQLLLLCTYCSFSLAASDASCIFSIHGDRRGSDNVSSIVSASTACTGREAVQLQLAQSLIPYINNFTGQLAQSSP